MSVQTGLVVTDRSAAILWDVSLPLESIAEVPSRPRLRDYRAAAPQRDPVVLRDIAGAYPAPLYVVVFKGLSLAMQALGDWLVRRLTRRAR